MTDAANRVSTLLQVVTQLSKARRLEDITTIVRHAARELTGADGATFVLREKDTCYYADEEAISPLWKGHRFPMEMCISGWAMLNRQTVVIPDIYKDTRIPWDAYRPTFVKSLVMVPVHREAPIAAIGCYWSVERDPSIAEIEIIQSLADAVSISMENIGLYAALEEKVQALSRANKAKDEFLMNLSHELRTPLNAILGWGYMLEQGSLDASDIPLAGSTIVRNGKSQERMIAELLDICQIIAGKLILEKKRLDPTELLRTTVEGFAGTAKEKNIKLTLEAPDQSEGSMLGDGPRIQQVISNLVANALKFTPNNGHVHVSMRREGPTMRIVVKDDGLGLTPEQLPHIFERFWQADGTTTRAFGGLGLGLAIVHDLATALGGRIEAHSEGAGKGSTFTLWLPLNQLTQAETKPLQGLKILAVDDQNDVLIMLKRVLLHFGANVVTTNQVSDAMAAMNTEQFDILISDLSMPGEDGFSLMRKVRSMGMYRNQRLPAIAFSAFADRENEQEAHTAGFDAFVAKPLQPVSFVKVIQDLTNLDSNQEPPQ